MGIYQSQKHKHGQKTQNFYQEMSKNSKYKCRSGLANDVMCSDQYLQRNNNHPDKLSTLMVAITHESKSPATDPITKKYLRPMKPSYLFGFPHLIEYLYYLPMFLNNLKKTGWGKTEVKMVEKGANIVASYLSKNQEAIQGRIEHLEKLSITPPKTKKSAATKNPLHENSMLNGTYIQTTPENPPSSVSRKRSWQFSATCSNDLHSGLPQSQ